MPGRGGRYLTQGFAADAYLHGGAGEYDFDGGPAEAELDDFSWVNPCLERFVTDEVFFSR